MEVSQSDIDKYACGNLPGTVYGPEEYLTEKQKRFRRMNYEEYDNYEKKVNETEGFDVDGCTGRMPGRISQLCEGCNEWKAAEVVAKHAAQKQGEAMGIPIELVRLVKANIQPVAGILYYLTFVAITKDQMEKTYRVKVWRKPVTCECEIVLFLDGSEGKKDITVKRKADEMVRGRGKRASAKKEHIKFNLRDYFRKPVELFVNPTITISAEQLQKDGCHLLAEKLKKENPQWTDAEVMSIASSKWKLFRYPDKAPFLDEAWKMFERQHPQYYPNTKY
ncbi:uncharacterized protein LOC141596393 [Silene latifolia]|uniref:uncharacterized protein LOC141596393 n=1 Tax=Silene latifolia TaxID=37657 RepID=UPI003D783F3E